MPRYFFHLSFGHRTVPDEEGVELSNRSAARDEALAVVRDLANPERSGNPRRWASWFLQVADEQGQFFRAPIGHPALEVVEPDAHELRDEEPDVKPIRPIATVAARQEVAAKGRSAEIVREMRVRRQRTAQLLQENQQLRGELSSVYRVSEEVRIRAGHVIALARLAR